MFVIPAFAGMTEAKVFTAIDFVLE